MMEFTLNKNYASPWIKNWEQLYYDGNTFYTDIDELTFDSIRNLTCEWKDAPNLETIYQFHLLCELETYLIEEVQKLFPMLCIDELYEVCFDNSSPSFARLFMRSKGKEEFYYEFREDTNLNNLEEVLMKLHHISEDELQEARLAQIYGKMVA